LANNRIMAWRVPAWACPACGGDRTLRIDQIGVAGERELRGSRKKKGAAQAAPFLPVLPLRNAYLNEYVAPSVK
jgi:hypothetical protein